MDTQIYAALIGVAGVVIVNQWILHLQNRRAAAEKAEKQKEKDNRLAVLLENFPPHRHRDHVNIDYPTGMHPLGKP